MDPKRGAPNASRRQTGKVSRNVVPKWVPVGRWAPKCRWVSIDRARPLGAAWYAHNRNSHFSGVVGARWEPSPGCPARLTCIVTSLLVLRPAEGRGGGGSSLHPGTFPRIYTALPNALLGYSTSNSMDPAGISCIICNP